jgi:hypothetical protein
MWHPRIAAAAVSFSFAVLLTLPDVALGQRPAPGMRGHSGGTVRSPPRSPVLRGRTFVLPMGAPRSTVDPRIGRIRRGFVDHGFRGGYRSRLNGFGSSGFPRHHPGFFFPRHHSGFFFFSGFGFFGGFPFFDSFLLFDGFSRHPARLFSVPRRRLVSGFPHRRLGLLRHQPIPAGPLLGWSPYLGTWSGYGYPYLPAAGAYATETTPTADISPVSDTRPVLGRQLAVPGIGEGTGDTLVVEQVSLMDIAPRPVLRLTWQNPGLEAAQVVLFLADTAQSVLSAQTLRSPPFTALFEPSPGTRFVGMTVVWPDGTLSTRFVPYPSQARR